MTTKGILNDSGDKSGSGLKRKPEVSLHGQKGKKVKMNCYLKIHSGSILKKLSRHMFSPIFSEPVDPVALNIPDYFSVISKPMDLGTVKRKLEDDMYLSAEDFAADVKLIFSNATRYNPKENPVHKMAMEMYGDFCRRWKQFEAKLKQAKEVDDRGSFVHHVTKECVGSNMRGTNLTGLDKKSIDVSPDHKKLWKLTAEVSSMDATCEKVIITFSPPTGFNV